MIDLKSRRNRLQEQEQEQAQSSHAAVDEGTAGLLPSTFNLVKSTVGSGVLSLPMGLGSVSSSPTAVAPAIAVLALACAISGYCFTMVARVCQATGSKSWTEAWSKSVGESSAWIPPSLISLLTVSISIQYTMVMGSSFSSLFFAWGLPPLLATRTGAILLLTVGGTLPLSMLPSLSALSFTSFLGVSALLYTAGFMVVRMPAYAAGSVLYAAVPPALQPKFDSVLAFSPKVFVLISMLASAFLCHFVAPNFYKELSPGRVRAPSRRSNHCTPLPTGCSPLTHSPLRTGRRRRSAHPEDEALLASQLRWLHAIRRTLLSGYDRRVPHVWRRVRRLDPKQLRTDRPACAAGTRRCRESDSIHFPVRARRPA